MPLRLFVFALVLSVTACRSRSRVDAENSLQSEGSVQLEGAGKEVVDSGCEGLKNGTCDHRATETTTQQSEKAKHYGAPLGKSPQVSLADLLTEPAQYHEKAVTVSGHVRRACSRKGCWMELSTGPDKAAQGCRVTFKDYGFFVPTDSAGMNAVVEGRVEVTRVEKQAVDHYESEGAHFPHKDETGSAREVRLIATGVTLSQPSI